MSLLRHASTIGGLTLVSRVLGMVRDMLMARFVGAGLASDAFLIAWRLPNLFRALFAEGAFSAVFVPFFNRKMSEAELEKAESGKKVAVKFASQVLSVLLPFLILFTLIMTVLAGPIVWAMTGGFADTDPDYGLAKFQLATYLTRITFPYLALVSIVSLFGGILNSLNRFWVNAFAPIFLNICMIVALLFFRGDTQIETAVTQAIAVTTSGVMQLLLLYIACRREGVRLKIGLPRLSPDVKKMLWLIGPAAIGQGAIQLNLVISTSLAARFLPEGAVSYLYYSDRLNQLPLGILGIGIGTAILPALSRQIGSSQPEAANATQNRALELAYLLALPAAIALCIAAIPLVRGVFQYGAFTESDTLGTASALAAFALGVPAYVIIKILTPGFYARQDTKTPVRLAFYSMLVNLIGNLSLIWHFGHVGVALATALSAWVNALLLYAHLQRRGHFRLEPALLTRLIKITLAGAIMGAALWFLNPHADAYMAGSVWERFIALTILCGSGGLIYAIAIFATRAYSLRELRAKFSRTPAKKAG